MDSVRSNRKVLPNYLLDDYVPTTDSKSSNHGSKSVSSHHTHPEGSHPSLEHASAQGNGSVNGAEQSDASGGPFGFLPRRKKKLRQACVYCRRSHLVCEEKRPCHRCVKRGIADRCVDPPPEGQLLQDGSWNVAAETGSSSGSVKDAFISPPPAVSSSASANSELVATDAGPKRKRRAKTEGPRLSAPPHRQGNDIEAHSDYNRPHGAFEFTPTPAPYAPTADHAHSIPTSSGSGPDSSLSGAVPTHTASPFAPLPGPLPVQSEPTGTARGAPSQLLQGQPIFQPPSSAELDSLFSTYFFDVADAFSASARPNAGPHGPHQGVRPSQQSGPVAHLYHPQPPQHAPGPHRSDTQYHAGGSTLQAAHDHRVEHSVGHGGEQRGFQPAQHPPQMLVSHPQQPRQQNLANIAENSPANTPTNGVNASFVPAPAQSAPTRVPARNSGLVDGKNEHEGAKSKEAIGRQKPGDVYAPYPYRKGYASLMRYMTEQNWSEQSIRSVEAALSKIRRLWFSLEDNIQPSSMIQLQAEWAGNVRYFSESVLPFTPIPMVVCRKAGEVYASNQLAQDLCGRSRDQMTGGKLSCYELMTESSASKFFRLYELAVGGTQAEDGSYVPTVGNTAPLYWNAEIVRPNADGTSTVLPTRGIFEMKIAPCGLPSLLVCCFVPLS